MNSSDGGFGFNGEEDAMARPEEVSSPGWRVRWWAWRMRQKAVLKERWLRATAPVVLWNIRRRQQSAKRGITAMSRAQAERCLLISFDDSKRYTPNVSFTAPPAFTAAELERRSRIMHEAGSKPRPEDKADLDWMEIIRRRTSQEAPSRPGSAPSPKFMMRTLRPHDITEPRLVIRTLDEAGPGGANHVYGIWKAGEKPPLPPLATISFQNGGIAECGVNGVSHEALLTIIVDRLGCFQSGDYPHPSNEEAKLFCLLAMNALHRRTHERLKRGVEGKVVA